MGFMQVITSLMKVSALRVANIAHFIAALKLLLCLFK